MAGSVREKRPGVWQVRVSLGRDPDTGRYRTLAREIRGTRRDAERAAARLVTEVEDGKASATRGSVADLLTRWLEHQESRGLAPRTLHSYRGFAKRIAAELGKTELRKLKAADLDRFYARLVAEGLSAKSVHHYHATLRAALRQARRWELIAVSPADNASPPAVRTVEATAPSPEEVRRLISAVEESNPDLAVFLFMAATTGMRRGELCGLQWGDVDFDRLDVLVRRAVSSVPGQRLVVRAPKTGRSRRLALDPATAEILRRHRQRVVDRCTAVGAGLAPDSYVFSRVADHSQASPPDGWTQAFDRLRDRLELQNVRLHDLRHFAATMALSAGVDVRTVAGRLGHAQPTLTLRTYAHVVEAADRRAAEAIANSLSPADSQRSR
jgi:integrase